jgi:uncharacterized surface protein with fasciclin (FAS1) repeats
VIRVIRVVRRTSTAPPDPHPDRAAPGSHTSVREPLLKHQTPTKEGITMRRIPHIRGLLCVLAALSFVAAACGDDDDDAAAPDDATEEPSDAAPPDGEDTSETGDSGGAGNLPANTAEICETDQLVEAVESGPTEGTLAGMTDDPVGTAATSNPVLTTLVTAVTEANLVDTLNTAPDLTVFAPTDCAFAALDPATLDAALADPTGLLTQVLGFHVIPGQRLSSEDLATTTELTTFSGVTLPIAAEGDQITVADQATVVVPDIQTANATVHLIDNVMVPPG